MARVKKEEIDFKYNWKIYFSFIKKYKATFTALILLALILETLYVVDKFFFKIIIDKGGEYVAGTLAAPAYIHILILIAGSYLILSIVKVVGRWVHTHLINHVDADLMFDLKQKFFNHIIHLDHNFHTTHKTGSLISRLSRGASAIERMSDFIVFNTLPLVFQLVLVGASLIYFDIATGIVVIITAVCFIVYSLFILQKQKQANADANRAEDIEKGYLADVFTNIDSIKHFGKEQYIKQRFVQFSSSSRDKLVKHWDYYRWFNAGHIFILTLGTFFLIYFPIKGFLAGTLSLGTLVFIYTVYGNLFDPLFGFVNSVRGYYRSMADFQDLFKYGKFQNEIKDKPDAEELVIQDGAIEFNNVGFDYGKRKIFDKFSLSIPKNKKVALVGHSGSGKSTLVKLLYRLYDVDKGQILIDGKDVKEFKQESLRSELSIVPQECVLFDDTVYNNVAFSKPDATRDEVLEAMKFAQLDKVVKDFPKKENTIVGERGVRLSGGEKQRVSIARALLANKKILVLDEATSSLDSQTEHNIQKDLQSLMQNRTSIIIAHRLSTIMSADLIVVLDKGKIVQMGTHRELIAKSGTYKKLWSLQKGGYLQD